MSMQDLESQSLTLSQSQISLYSSVIGSKPTTKRFNSVSIPVGLFHFQTDFSSMDKPKQHLQATKVSYQSLSFLQNWELILIV